MKKTRILFLSVFFLISATIGVFAANGIKKVEAHLRPDFQVFLDGKKVNVGPILLYNDKSYLPVSEVGKLVGAEINWKAENKGIYINQRYQGQPTDYEDPDLIYEEVMLFQPILNIVSYLGGDYPVLTNISYENKTYYREKDINRMGIDTRGLRKARDPFTSQLYINKDEIAVLWKEKPVFNPSYEFMIIGEKDEAKIETVKDFIDRIPATQAILNGEDPEFAYYNRPIVYTVDALPENAYNILCFEDGKFTWYWLKLKQNMYDDWYESEHTKKTQELNWFQ